MKAQALGWLAAAALAAGLNASYHNGGLEWAHRVVDQVSLNTGAVLALATGHVNDFATEARLLSIQDESRSCRWATALARSETRMARAENQIAHFEVTAARHQAQFDRLAAQRTRMEARLVRISVPATSFAPLSISVPRVPCSSGQVRIPRLPQINMPRISMPQLPVIQIQSAAAGPA